MSKEFFSAITRGKRLPWKSDHEAVVWLIFMLLVIGTVNVFSSTFVIGENDYGDPYFFLKRHFISLLLGAITFGIGSFVHYHHWKKLLNIGTVLLFMSLVLVLLKGPVINGSQRWLYIGSISFQPAEFVKLGSIMLAAVYISLRYKARKKLNVINKNYLLIAGMAVLVELEPDMGTCCVIAGIPLVMLVLAGVEWQQIKALLLIITVGVVGLCTYQTYRLKRILVAWDPWSAAQGVGYQTVSSLKAVGSGGLFGMGMGQGLSKYAYLPEAHTDFAFAVFSQEQGFICVVVVLLLYALLAYYIALIARNAMDIEGQMLAAGFLMLLVGQAIVNLLMVVGCFPVVGIPLPFISYAGTSLIMSLFAAGVLVNIGKNGRNARAKKQGNNATVKAKRPKLRLVK